jgi:hypothetical protein
MGFVNHKDLVHFYSQKNPYDISKIWVSQGKTKKGGWVFHFIFETHTLCGGKIIGVITCCPSKNCPSHFTNNVLEPFIF